MGGTVKKNIATVLYFHYISLCSIIIILQLCVPFFWFPFLLIRLLRRVKNKSQMHNKTDNFGLLKISFDLSMCSRALLYSRTSPPPLLPPKKMLLILSKVWISHFLLFRPEILHLSYISTCDSSYAIFWLLTKLNVYIFYIIHASINPSYMYIINDMYVWLPNTLHIKSIQPVNTQQSTQKYEWQRFKIMDKT